MDIAAMLGSLLGGSWTAGMLLHFVNGSLIFPVVYGLVMYERLPGAPAARGTLWSVVRLRQPARRDRRRAAVGAGLTGVIRVARR
jgi:hypothetical protein